MSTSIRIYNKENCIALISDINEQIQNVRTTYDLVRMDDIQLANNDNKTVIAQMLIELNKFVNTSRSMNEAQIVETVNMMLREYPNLSLQEYQYFFNKIKTGYFGHLYESIDGIKIMSFLRQFYKDVLDSWNDLKSGEDYQRKIDQKSRDINDWKKY